MEKVRELETANFQFFNVNLSHNLLLPATHPFKMMVKEKSHCASLKVTVDLQECLSENRSYEHRLQ